MNFYPDSLSPDIDSLKKPLRDGFSREQNSAKSRLVFLATSILGREKVPKIREKFEAWSIRSSRRSTS